MNDEMLATVRLEEHVNVGDNAMVSPVSNRFANAGKVAQKVFSKTYGTILAYPPVGQNAGRVLVEFICADGEKLTWWFSVEDLFVRPAVVLKGSIFFTCKS